jgi:hypothetical protein
MVLEFQCRERRGAEKLLTRQYPVSGTRKGMGSVGKNHMRLAMLRVRRKGR